MQEDQEENLTRETAVYEEFPFLIAFPYPEYAMSIERDEDYATAAGIDPVIISAAGGIVKPEFINFHYHNNYTKITLSFYTYDISYISECAERIKKLNYMNEMLNYGLASESIFEKLESIKKGERFLNKLGSSLTVGKAFDKVFDQMLLSSECELDKSNIKKIKSMSKNIVEDEYEHDVLDIIQSYYNLHLHHIKILLGVVIAVKIY
jgi:hypothetical protein